MEDDDTIDKVFRVPFLSKEDIIECGFREDKEFTEDKHRKDNYPNMFSFKKGAKRNGKEVLLSLVAHLDKNIVIIMYADDFSRPAFKTIFDGTIKNINELQRLIKQLNIE